MSIGGPFHLKKKITKFSYKISCT